MIRFPSREERLDDAVKQFSKNALEPSECDADNCIRELSDPSTVEQTIRDDVEMDKSTVQKVVEEYEGLLRDYERRFGKDLKTTINVVREAGRQILKKAFHFGRLKNPLCSI